MSLKPRRFDPIPEETVQAARAAFPKGNVYLRMGDEFGALYTDEAFAELFSTRGQPAQAPGCLALVTGMQFAEGLSDRQAADAVRARMDWKYALGLKLTDAGFDASVLSEFRGRLVAGGAETVRFETLLERFGQAGLVKARASTHGLDPCAGGDPDAESTGMCGRDAAPCAQCAGGSRAALVTSSRPSAVV